MYSKIVLLFIAIAFSAMSHAETIKLKLGEQGQQQQLELPQRGLSMEQVEAQYGAPESKSEPRGEPPISSWQYPSFSVYFENQTVIHSVIKHKPQKSE